VTTLHAVKTVVKTKFRKRGPGMVHVLLPHEVLYYLWRRAPRYATPGFFIIENMIVWSEYYDNISKRT